ncbi:MAG: hypothetical protein ACRDBM_15250 [Sporomusa sp.]
MAIITNTCTDTNNSFNSETENNTSRSTTKTTSTTTDNLSLINTLLADVNAVIPNYLSLVSSYRLLVGASEEIHRIPGVPFEIFERSVIRFDRAGTLIDTLNELLCCKLAFSSDLLSITCAPIDIVRLMSDCISPSDDQCSTAEQIVVLEALRQTLFRRCTDESCFGPPPEGITPTPPPGAPPTAAPQKKSPEDILSDLETTQELETEVSVIPASPNSKPKLNFKSPLTRRHI